MDQVQQADFAGAPLLFRLFHTAGRVLNRQRFDLSFGSPGRIPVR
jgi:hypothetical protein